MKLVLPNLLHFKADITIVSEYIYHINQDKFILYLTVEIIFSSLRWSDPFLYKYGKFLSIFWCAAHVSKSTQC